MKRIKVLIIDDSAVIRNIVKEVLSNDALIEVVGEAKDPFVAREQIKKLNPDVITLDVEMPKMDGITFLENLMRLRPMPVVMLSTLTTKGAEVTLEALELGALDFIAKPSFENLLVNNDFKNILLKKIKAAVKVDQKNFAVAKSLSHSTINNVLPFKGVECNNHLIAIGASTGGTEAIKQILTVLPSNSPAIVITQHIPKNFSASFAKRLNQMCTITVLEAQHGQKIKEGHAYIAPGDQHLTVVLKGGSLFCVLADSAPVNRHRPAVDVLFNSLIPLSSNIQAVLLTGMGQDGAKGMLSLKNVGARTVIQNKNSSLVWGMPGSAFAIDAHKIELELSDISKSLLKYASLNSNQMKEVN
jgi:two-component system chemotaxis response regulator CheB